MTAERIIRVGQSKRPTHAFNGPVAKRNEVVIRDRAAKAVERLSARHEANSARLVATRFTKLLKADRNEPTLKPSWAVDDKRSWLHRAARHQVANDFKKRINRVHKVADRMIETAKGKGKQRDGLER
jgi:hypothetical protein